MPDLKVGKLSWREVSGFGGVDNDADSSGVLGKKKGGVK